MTQHFLYICTHDDAGLELPALANTFKFKWEFQRNNNFLYKYAPCNIWDIFMLCIYIYITYKHIFVYGVYDRIVVFILKMICGLHEIQI